MTSDAKFCSQCGHELTDPNPPFCSQCGAAVTSQLTETPSSQEPVNQAELSIENSVSDQELGASDHIASITRLTRRSLAIRIVVGLLALLLPPVGWIAGPVYFWKKRKLFGIILICISLWPFLFIFGNTSPETEQSSKTTQSSASGKPLNTTQSSEPPVSAYAMESEWYEPHHTWGYNKTKKYRAAFETHLGTVLGETDRGFPRIASIELGHGGGPDIIFYDITFAIKQNATVLDVQKDMKTILHVIDESPRPRSAYSVKMHATRDSCANNLLGAISPDDNGKCNEEIFVDMVFESATVTELDFPDSELYLKADRMTFDCYTHHRKMLGHGAYISVEYPSLKLDSPFGASPVRKTPHGYQTITGGVPTEYELYMYRVVGNGCYENGVYQSHLDYIPLALPHSSLMPRINVLNPEPLPIEHRMESVHAVALSVANEDWDVAHSYFTPEFQEFCETRQYADNNAMAIKAFKQRLGIPPEDLLQVVVGESTFDSDDGEVYIDIAYRNVEIIKGKPNEPREWVFQDGEWWLDPIDWDQTCLNDYSTIPIEVRYGTTGHLDRTFGEETSIEVAGNTEFFGSGLVKLPDTRCDGPKSCGNSILIQPDHRIVIGLQGSFRLIRLMPDGDMDEAFGQDGMTKVLPFGSDQNPTIEQSILQDDEKILLAGSSRYGTRFGAVRYLPNGDIDDTFGEDGILTALHDMGRVYAMDVQSNGNILFAGRRSDEEPWNLYDYTDVEHPQLTIERIGSRCVGSRLIRTDQYGSIDKSFGYSGMLCPEIDGRQANIFGLNVQSDDKLLIAFNSIGEGDHLGLTGLIRYSSEGHIDRSFGVNGVLETSDNHVGLITSNVLVQNDNSILISGYHSDGLGIGIEVPFVGKVRSDGFFDESFGDNGIILLTDPLHFTDSGRDGSLLNTIMLPSGEVFVVGQRGVGANNVWIIKFDSDGRIDRDFGTNGTVFTRRMFSLGWGYANAGVVIQGSNLILTGNYSSGYQGQSSGMLIQRRSAMPETYIAVTPAPITNVVPTISAPTPLPTPTKVPLPADYISSEDMSFSGDRWEKFESQDCTTESCLTLSNVSPGATSKMILNIFHPSDFRADKRHEGSTISFWVKTSLPACCESLKFMINDDLVGEWTGNSDWTLVNVPLPTIRPANLHWQYTRTNTSEKGIANSMWLKDIIID